MAGFSVQAVRASRRFQIDGTALLKCAGSLFGAFLKDDVGKLAIDAVNYAATFTDEDGDGKREISRNQLVRDAEKAGNDLVNAGDSLLNFLIEAALQAVIAGAVTEAVTT